MDVAVAKVAKAAGNHARKGAFDFGGRLYDETGHVCDRDRNVVGQRLAFGALSLGNGIPDFPERLRLRLIGGKHSVTDNSIMQRASEQSLQLTGDLRSGVG